MDPTKKIAKQALLVASNIQNSHKRSVSQIDNKGAQEKDLERFVPQEQKVFIVHGHDEANLYKLKELVKDRLNLEPVILKLEAGRGRTLIEKFEQEARNCAFCFVLFTPDDFVSKPNANYLQARPNVIFELGWFYGRLGRSRVAILLREGTKLHSDLDGISKIEFRDSVNEKVLEIEKELEAIGIIPYGT